ncbi:hypothetical protein UNDKW_2310 [Undibacterium sp. KW1]|uniref:hypothetical protein n=1 Tax=Undibacterium sp. KW1 TaxID=2058624 RepID=UPI001331E64F|nr:hypothetical protein [Undibacterium sp. KW1]BBB60583.1 hypothetical protein UNDKW_2310 [Undibacterium sp. KW1]
MSNIRIDEVEIPKVDKNRIFYPFSAIKTKDRDAGEGRSLSSGILQKQAEELIFKRETGSFQLGRTPHLFRYVNSKVILQGGIQ